MIKAAIDALRAREGYAGMAAYRGGRLLFRDGLAPELADTMRSLFDQGEATFNAHTVTVVIRGYTITMFAFEDILLICRVEGRFTPISRPVEEVAEYAPGHEAVRLLAREEARKEAERTLKRLMASG